MSETQKELPLFRDSGITVATQLPDSFFKTEFTLLEKAGFERFSGARPDQLRFYQTGIRTRAVINRAIPGYILFFDSVDKSQRLLRSVARDVEFFGWLIRKWQDYCAEVIANAQGAAQAAAEHAIGQIEVDGESDGVLCDCCEEECACVLGGDEQLAEATLNQLADGLWYTGYSIEEGLMELGLNPDEYDIEQICEDLYSAGMEECSTCGWWFSDSELNGKSDCESCLKRDAAEAAEADDEEVEISDFKEIEICD